MNCRTCNYSLWNLPDRRCPECGTEFLPSQYDFVPRSVRYLCPHCQQQYFGTDAQGHLIPRSFNCVNCHAAIDMDEMILVPAENATEKQTQKDINPWTEPTFGGFFKRWRTTVGRSMVAPTRLIDSTSPLSSTRRAFGFALANTMLPWLLSSGIFALLFIPFFIMTTARGGASVGYLNLLSILVWLVGPLILIPLWGAITHFILAVTGPTEPFRRTAHGLFYSSGPFVICVPCIGVYFTPVALIWWGVCATMMLTRIHKASGFRAALAVFTPIILVLGGIAALVILFMSWAMSMAATAAQQAATSVQAAIQSQRAVVIATTLQSQGLANGSYPRHAAELLSTSTVGIGEFSLSSNPLDADGIPLANTTLGKFDSAAPAVQQQIITAAASSLPASVIAHRVGDYVFTYHGITPNAADPGLWLFIAEVPAPPPPPAGTPTQNSGTFSASPSKGFNYQASAALAPSFIVGLPSGRTTTIGKPSFPAALSAQNALRATLSLPPLPDPTTVTETNPALGPK